MAQKTQRESSSHRIKTAIGTEQRHGAVHTEQKENSLQGPLVTEQRENSWHRTVVTEQILNSCHRQGAVPTEQKTEQLVQNRGREQFTQNREELDREKNQTWSSSHGTDSEQFAENRSRFVGIYNRERRTETEQLAHRTVSTEHRTVGTEHRTIGTEQLAQKRDRPLDTEHLVQNRYRTDGTDNEQLTVSFRV